MEAKDIVIKVAIDVLPLNLIERFRGIGCIDEVKQFGEASFMAGIREVVDSFNDAETYPNLDTRRQEYEEILREWQAKLKKWEKKWVNSS